MFNKLLFHRFPTLKSLLTRWQYDFLSSLNLKRDVLFMNFGYAAEHPHDHASITLDPDDEIHRYPLQMYQFAAKHAEWNNADALEVSSGRGGGASFIMRYFKPRSYVGVDFSRRAVQFCRSHHKLEGLRFEHGNAEALRFPDGSFDIVINIEASLYYPSLQKFLGHVKRVLKAGGRFLYADLRYREKVAEWHAQIKSLGLQVVKEEDITGNVLKALELNRERQLYLVNTHIPPLLRMQFLHFAGMSSNGPDAAPRLDDRRYWFFVLQKV